MLDFIFLRKTLFFASRAMSGLVRKRQPDTPYIIHPYSVGLHLLTESIQNTILIAVAFLHDLLEETNVSILTLEKNFGKIVTDLVVELTDPKILRSNKIILEEFKIKHIRESASNDAVFVSLVDKIDNAKSLSYELKNGLITDISRKENYYHGLLSSYKERQATVNNPVYNKMLLEYERIVLELWK
ncbi:MAG: HD domain-containing protein [Leptospiraceae bacterium]|nr:HD domain-containing protein [Leptospiraceae bacterium]